MSGHTQHSKELLAAIADRVNQLTGLMAAVDENKVNTVPYEGSWTAPQLLTHVAKSINGMARAMQTEGTIADRDSGERIEELSNIFLDLSRKFNAPAFIVPEEGPYERQATIDKLNRSFERFRESAAAANMNELVEGLPFGAVTKLEVIYFVLFHTERHLHQMRRICEALKK